MSVNKELLRATMAAIDADPKHWNQKGWRCGSSCCFAGFAAQLAGWKWKTKSSAPYDTFRVVRNDERVVRNDEDEFVEDAAREALGIDWIDADRLFKSTNRRKTLRRIVDELCESDG